MFLAHFGVGFGSKRLAPATSLGTLFLAAQLLDLLWPTLILLGLEHVAIVPGITLVTPLDFYDYPISHSLLAVVGWGILFAITYGALRKYRRGAVVCGVAVVSHWILDLTVHRPDLPLVPHGQVLLGMGLWNSLWGTLALELSVLAAGLWIYLCTTRALDRVGGVSLWALVGFLLVVYGANIFGPPPTDTTAIAWVGQAQWLLVVWGYWIDRHRTAISHR